MPPSQPAPGRSRRSALAVVAVAVVASIVGAWGCRTDPSASWSTATSSTTSSVGGSSSAPARPSAVPPVSDGADSAVPDGTTVFDEDVAGVARLDPALLAALRRAATDAAADGVRFEVNSGWRSRAYQEQLLREAIQRYGSERAAARWVAPPDRSAHVAGDAVDLAEGAASWLSRHGTAYGLCQIYDNEPWHYELRPDAAVQGCPGRYPDAAHDPRMQP